MLIAVAAVAVCKEKEADRWPAKAASKCDWLVSQAKSTAAPAGWKTVIDKDGYLAKNYACELCLLAVGYG